MSALLISLLAVACNNGQADPTPDYQETVEARVNATLESGTREAKQAIIDSDRGPEIPPAATAAQGAIVSPTSSQIPPVTATPNPYADPLAYAHADAHSNAHADPSAHADPRSSYSHGYRYSCSPPDFHADARAHRYTYAIPDADPSRGGGPRDCSGTNL